MLSASQRAWMRQQTEDNMPDRVTITRESGEVAFDTDTGVTTRTTTTIYGPDGRARIAPGPAATNVIHGGEDVTLSQFDIHVPWDIAGVAIDDYVAVTRSDDATLEARRFIVLQVVGRSYDLVRVLRCQVVE